MLVVVSDASVLIDIENSNLTSAMFSLGWQFTIPDILYFEELAEKHGHLSEYGLIIRTMDGELVTEAQQLHSEFTKPSMNDLLALTLAKHEKCQLLTADKALKDVAKRFQIETHGTIWLVEQMIVNNKITVNDAYSGFQRMKQTGSWLPWVEIEKMLDGIEVEVA